MPTVAELVGTKSDVVDPEPNATALSFSAFAPVPIAVVLAPVACAASAGVIEPPIATEFVPEAFADVPPANEAVPDAFDAAPTAVARSPEAEE